jgi:hypothetical protein
MSDLVERLRQGQWQTQEFPDLMIAAADALEAAQATNLKQSLQVAAKLQEFEEMKERAERAEATLTKAREIIEGYGRTDCYALRFPDLHADNIAALSPNAEAAASMLRDAKEMLEAHASLSPKEGK